jgi:hypothetical protein
MTNKKITFPPPAPQAVFGVIKKPAFAGSHSLIFLKNGLLNEHADVFVKDEGGWNTPPQVMFSPPPRGLELTMRFKYHNCYPVIHHITAGG